MISRADHDALRESEPPELLISKKTFEGGVATLVEFHNNRKNLYCSENLKIGVNL